jgi:Photosynthesis system II assembly factor YCF48/Putative zinc-finger
MPELSTLLRQRLRAVEKPTLPHPDADVLTAYAEALLPPGEREQVLKHLALCGECRDVVALTMPDALAPAEQEQEVIAVEAAPVRRRRWFMTPAFGLAGSIAVMVVGLALILQLPRTQQKTFSPAPAQQAANQTSPSMPTREPATQPAAETTITEQAGLSAPPAPPQSRADERREFASSGAVAAHNQPATPQTRVPAKPAATPVAPVTVADLRKQDYVNRMFLANAYDSQIAAPNYRDLPQAPLPQGKLGFAPPSVVAGNSLQSGNFDIAANSQGRNQGVVTVSPSQAPDHGPGILGKIVDLGKRPLGRQRPPIPSTSLNDRAMFKPGTTVVQPGEAIAASTADSASINGNGMLAQSPAFNSSALAYSRRALLGSTPYQWKVVEGKLLRSSDLRNWSEENPGGENVHFSVVSANGPEIWAGGTDAALMHSQDGGTRWERVTLGASATGTINSIEAAGPNLHVRSSSGQSWASQDGGRSWSLQD